MLPLLATAHCTSRLLNSKGDSLLLRAIGYYPLAVAVQEVRHHQPLRVQILPMSNQLNEAVVSGQRVMHTQNAVANTIGTADIAKNLGNTFAGMLEQVSGVSMIQTGSTIAKPVVHGMYGNRLLIMNNGVRQQDNNGAWITRPNSMPVRQVVSPW